jgi:hypothetical protein
MTSRARLLLALTVIGFVVPNAFVGVYLAREGLDLGGYFGAWSETLPAAQLIWDLAIAATAFVVWAAWDSRRSGVSRWRVVIPASLLVGLCFALPLYLYLRERAMQPAPA